MGPEHRLKLRHYRLVVAIEETGSVRRAAELIGITQPAASSMLRELEGILGVALFVRTQAGTTATPFGKTLVRHGQLLLSNVRASVEEIVQSKNGDAGEVRVGILPASAMSVLPASIYRSARTRPNVVVHVIEGATHQLLPALERGELDLIIGRVAAAQIPPHIEREELLIEPNEVVCRAHHPLTAGGTPSLSQLAEAQWILPAEGTHLRSDVHAAFLRAGLKPPTPVVVTSSTTLRVSLVETTDLICVLTRRAAITAEQRGLLSILEVNLLSPNPPTLLLRMANTAAPPVAAAFAQLIRDEAATVHRRGDPHADVMPELE